MAAAANRPTMQMTGFFMSQVYALHQIDQSRFSFAVFLAGAGAFGVGVPSRVVGDFPVAGLLIKV